MTPAAAAAPEVRGTGPRALVRRFTGAERALHWLFTLDVTALTLSGLGLYLPPDRNPVLDRRELVRSVHIDAALLLLALPVVLSALRPGALARVWRDVEVFDRDDWRWLARIWRPRPLRHAALPPQGRFNAGQKLNTILIAAATVGFLVTGVLMYLGGHEPPSVADAADTWHIWLMDICAPLVGGHLVLALLVPSTRPALRGIVTGWVRLDFARRRHARWVEPESGGSSG